MLILRPGSKLSLLFHFFFIKGIVHAKMDILFYVVTHPHVIPNPLDFFFFFLFYKYNLIKT